MTKTSFPVILFSPIIIGIVNLSILAFALSNIEYLFLKRDNVFKINLPSEEKNAQFNGRKLLKLNKNKKFVSFIVTGDDWEKDDPKINAIRTTALQMKYSCDRSMVIRIHFMNDVDYGQVMRMFNMTVIDQHRRWMLLDNDMYIFPPSENECNEKEPEYLVVDTPILL